MYRLGVWLELDVLLSPWQLPYTFEYIYEFG